MKKPLAAALIVMLIGAAAFLLARPASGASTLLGPTPYLSQADSPFDLASGNFYLEDFEDNMLNTPGVSASAGSLTGPGGLTDSVDGDDGAIDGSGTNGHSFFSSPGSVGITFTFDPVALGSLPTAAGIVWTDGEGDTTFEAFDAIGMSLGTIGPVSIADGSVVGTTAEDRFFGVIETGGISAIKISNVSGGIEVDHLQYSKGNLPVSTTTTTLPPGDCGSTPVGPTFASLDCRLDALIAQIQAATDIPQEQAQLVKQLTKAKERKEQALTACSGGDVKHGRSRLKQTIRKMIQFGERLRSNTGRRRIPGPFRAELIATGNGIKSDLQTLRGALTCPGDALGG